MNYYWAIIIVIIESIATLFLASRYALELKHSYDEDYHSEYPVNIYQVLFIGAFFGGVGLILSYIFLKPIRREDRLNSYIFLWLTLLLSVLQIVAIILLVHFNILVGA